VTDPEPDDLPTVTCDRCDRSWDLGYELDDMEVGNQAVEQFALDHKRHTGHFPDDVATWRAACRRCPEGAERLSEHAARRWAATHARHTRHAVDLHHADGETTSRVDP
jgi:ferredoxin